MAKRKEINAQSTMEYLMTYGWAVLVIAVVLTALIALGIFNTGSTNFCAAQSGYSCSDPTYLSNTITFTISQDSGQLYYGDWVFVASQSQLSDASGLPQNFSAANAVELGRLNSDQLATVNFTNIAIDGVRRFNISGIPTNASVGQQFNGYIWLGYCTSLPCTTPTNYQKLGTINVRNSGASLDSVTTFTTTYISTTSSSTSISIITSSTATTSSTSTSTLTSSTATTSSTSTSTVQPSGGGGCGSNCYAEFQESGLPSGSTYTWSVTYGAYTQSASSTNFLTQVSVSFNESNSYSSSYMYDDFSFSVSQVSVTSAGCTTVYYPTAYSNSNYQGTSNSGELSGYAEYYNSVTTITFTESSSTCMTTFTQSGLPASAAWSVTYDGETQSSDTSTISFSTSPGSYSFSVSSVSIACGGGGTATYSPNPASSSLPAGSPENIVFSLTAPCVTTLNLNDLNSPSNAAYYTVSMSYDGNSVSGVIPPSTISDSKSWSTPPGNYIIAYSFPYADSGADSTNGCTSELGYAQAGSTINAGPYTCEVVISQYGLPNGDTWTAIWDGSSSGKLSSSTTSYEFGDYFMGSYSWSVSSSNGCSNSGTQYAGVDMAFGLASC